MANISTTKTIKRIKVSNDGAKYYGDLAKSYRDEAAASAAAAQESAVIASTKAAQTSAAATEALININNAIAEANTALATQTEASVNILQEETQDLLSDAISSINTATTEATNTIRTEKTTAINTIRTEKNTALNQIASAQNTATQTLTSAISVAASATEQAEIATTMAATATEQAEISSENAEATAIALSEAQRMKNSFAFFEFVRGGSLDSTQQAVYNAGGLDDERENYISGGTLDDIRMCADDMDNLNKLPLLKTQVNQNEKTLNTTVGRITACETEILDIQTHLSGTDETLTTEVARIDGDISDAVGRISQNELDIENLDADLDSAFNRIEQSENNITDLQNKTNLFNIIKGGGLDDTRSVYYSAGNLDTNITNRISGGTLDTMTVSKENLRDAASIPYLHSQIDDITKKLNLALDYIKSLKSGIVCANLDYRD